MQSKNRKLVFAIIILFSCLLVKTVECNVWYQEQEAVRQEEIPYPKAFEQETAPVQKLSKEKDELVHQIANAYVIFADSDKMLIHGDLIVGLHQPFIKDGLLYVPINGLAEYTGASLAEYDQMLYISSQGALSVIADSCNIALTDTTATFLSGKIVVEDSCYYVPAQDLNTLLHIPVYVSILQQTVIVGGIGDFSESDVAELRSAAGLLHLHPSIEESYLILCQKQKMSEEEMIFLLNEGRMYLTDRNGCVSKLQLSPDGLIIKKPYDIHHRYLPEQIYIAGKDSNRHKLYLPKSKNPVGPIPMLQEEEELRAEVGIRIQQKATRTEYDDISDDCEASWKYLKDQVLPGDFLLFHNPGAAARYGYCNHSALVLENTDRGIHLLQARGREDGVGADKDMDWLDFSKLFSDKYWKGNTHIYLCRVEKISSEMIYDMIAAAPEYYKDYQFGYGSFRGLKETNCAELITDTYSRYGINLVNADEGSRMRLLLDGKIRNLVVLPDDLALSDQVSILYSWSTNEDAD